MNENNRRCQEVIDRLGLHPKIAQHEPILNYETADKVDKELGWTGAETKTLFLKGKSGKFYLYITLSDRRMDQKQLKATFGENIKMVHGDEMTELTGMQPGCMTPFGLPDGLIAAVAVDTDIYQEELLIGAFGSETMSMEISAADLRTLLESVYSGCIYNL